MKNFSENFKKYLTETLETVKKCSGNFGEIYQYLFKLFSIPTWISSNYQLFLKIFEKQAQNFNKFFVKFTRILFIIFKHECELLISSQPNI